MTITETANKELTLVEMAEAKLKQLSEAMQLLDDIGGRLDWATDFCEYPSINEHLHPLSYAVSDAHDEIEDLYERVQEELDRYKELKNINDAEFDKESDLNYFLED